MQAFIEKRGMSKFSTVRVTERDENGIVIADVDEDYLHLLVKFPVLNKRKEYLVQILLPADDKAIKAAIKTEGERLLVLKQVKDALDAEAQAYMKVIAGSDVDRMELDL